MNRLKILIYALKVLMYKSIDEKGIRDFETINISTRLDRLIVEMQERYIANTKLLVN